MTFFYKKVVYILKVDFRKLFSLFKIWFYSKLSVNAFKFWFLVRTLICGHNKSTHAPRPECRPARRHKQRWIWMWGTLQFWALHSTLYLRIRVLTYSSNSDCVFLPIDQITYSKFDLEVISFLLSNSRFNAWLRRYTRKNWGSIHRDEWALGCPPTHKTSRIRTDKRPQPDMWMPTVEVPNTY